MVRRKRIKYLIMICASLINFTPAQNLDSLYNLLVGSIESKSISRVTTPPEVIKCGMGLIHDVKRHFDEFSPAQQNRLAKILGRPSKQTSIISGSGYFRIHYDTTGTEIPLYDIGLIAESADSVYKFEIDELGYPPPPEDDGEGGDDRYDIYISDLGSIYGYTEFIQNSGSTSFMVIDNDYADHYTKGIDGALVTIAHEFHHAIQVGNYLYRNDHRYYYELLSTSMEEFVYDDINDYYAYMPAYFSNPYLSLDDTPGGGYDIAVWNIFMQAVYGYDIIKASLEGVVDDTPLISMAKAIANEGGSFKTDLNNFGIWTYFTGSKAKEGKYFEEAADYPAIRPFMKYNFESNSLSLTVNSNPASNNFIQFSDNSSGFRDTLITIITNADFLSGNQTKFEYTLYNFETGDAKKINDLYYSHLSSLNKSIFAESNIFNDEIATQASTERNEIDYVYPQPFDYNKHSLISIPASRDPYGKASLNVYTSSMDLVFSAEKDIFALDKIIVQWNGLDSKGNKLPTGVYIYVTKSGDTVKKGKFVIYNE